jgi:hypothetical protein
MIDAIEDRTVNEEQDAQRVLAEHVNDLLARWHAWSAGHALVHGYPSVNTTCRIARSSRQYDDANGGLDAHIDCVLMEAVDAVVDAIPEPWKAALSVQARNLHTGRQVWSSPRLPSCAMLRGDILMAARKKFVDGLARGGLL